MEDIIKKRLFELAEEKNIKILFACEAGSRAWGFPSKDSDYDVRFIYCHPVNWYLSLSENKRDTIEWMSEDRQLDFVGWDIKKFLVHLRKSNPNIIEWLYSPIVYHERVTILPVLQHHATKAFNRVAVHYHYLSMAKNNFRRWLVTDRVRFKKYLYVLRPLMALNYISQFDTPVPVNYFELVDKCTVPDEIKERVSELIKRKANAEELDDLPRDEVLHAFIEKQLEQPKPSYEVPKVESFDELFQKIIGA